MKKYNCVCGNQLFFENTHCLTCKRRVGFDANSMRLLSLLPQDTVNGRQLYSAPDHQLFHYCKNHDDFNVCNWLVRHDHPQAYCQACSLNEIIPQVTVIDRRAWWHHLEQAKRRLMYTLLQLKLPLHSRHEAADGLAFAFLEDRRMNPQVEEEIVKTGHAEGLITVYLAEADDVRRESARVAMGESYRTLLGHFRHESGHYYFDRLIKNSCWYESFRDLFGDDTVDYEQALQDYYASSSSAESQPDFISDYAQSHPLEDWAECWAHYLHIVDTLETAHACQLTHCNPWCDAIDDWLKEWPRLVLIMNELNRSMGLKDPYPFVLSESVRKKLRFVHQVVDPTSRTN